MLVAVIADVGVGVWIVAAVAGHAAADMPGAVVTAFIDIDGAGLLLGKQAAQDEPADAGGDADAKIVVVVMQGMSRRRLNSTGQHGGGDGGGDKTGNECALEHDDLLASLTEAIHPPLDHLSLRQGKRFEPLSDFFAGPARYLSKPRFFRYGAQSGKGQTKRKTGQPKPPCSGEMGSSIKGE